MATFGVNGVLQAEYKYDAEGHQVVRKLTSPSVLTIHSVYDFAGRRVAEYNEATGALIREYVWLGWEPLAVIEGGVVNFIRSDHIGRPVFATNAAGVKTWTASYLPFGGVHTTTGNPVTTRFPGQWYQSESGLHQNWMRDYDPTTGRYLEADPLGLIDGASVYGYVGGNPMMRSDQKGLEWTHKTGKTIQCSKNCTIRIDFTVKDGVKTRHLHWSCRGSEGVCGEFGEESHGSSWEDAPQEVRECAIKHGFFGQVAGTKPLSGIADLFLLGIFGVIIAPEGAVVGIGGSILGTAQ